MHLANFLDVQMYLENTLSGATSSGVSTSWPLSVGTCWGKVSCASSASYSRPLDVQLLFLFLLVQVHLRPLQSHWFGNAH